MNDKRKISKGSNGIPYNRRPLMRNKSVYNRVIKSMVSHELEIHKTSVSTEDLSKVLTKMVYKSNSTAHRIQSMHNMLSKYSEKITNDCKILKLDPASEFDAPESSQCQQVSVELDNDKYENVNHDIKFAVDEKSIIPQEILKDIEKKVWEVQINPNCNVDKSNQSKIDECASKQAIKISESLNDPNNESNENTSPDTSMPKLQAFWRPQDTKTKNLKVGNQKSVKRELTYEKKRHLSKSMLCQIDIPPSLPKPSSKTARKSIDKLIHDVIILVKKRNLDARKQDTEILHHLENYLHSIHRKNSTEQDE